MSDKFFLAPTIVAAEKYIDISRDEIERALDEENSEFDYDWEETITDDLNTEHVVTLKLNINCKSRLMISWSISLKLHQIRIDGIDRHSRYSDREGNIHEGWHRHRFDPRKQRADDQRWPTNVLQGASERTQFLIRTLKEMNISVSGVDHGNYELFPN
ncbi:MAG: hypothetical protein WCF26_04340 [Candidatus Sulfotelmatobacter sp.]